MDRGNCKMKNLPVDDDESDDDESDADESDDGESKPQTDVVTPSYGSG